MALDWLLGGLVWLGLAEAPPAPVVNEPGLAVVTERLDDKALGEVLTGILEHVYAAFNADGEEAVYDGLAQVVAGELLTDLYLQQRRASVHGVMAGVAAEVVNVELYRQDSRAADGGYIVDAGWRVWGRLEHEDHGHERLNLYEAELAIRPVAGQWRLVDFNLDQVERVDMPEFVGGE